MIEDIVGTLETGKKQMLSTPLYQRQNYQMEKSVKLKPAQYSCSTCGSYK